MAYETSTYDYRPAINGIPYLMYKDEFYLLGIQTKILWDKFLIFFLNHSSKMMKNFPNCNKEPDFNIFRQILLKDSWILGNFSILSNLSHYSLHWINVTSGIHLCVCYCNYYLGFA